MSNKKQHPPVPQQASHPVPAAGQQIAVAQMVHRGPIPSAAEMKQYAEVFADLPQRIVQMAEAEQRHRFEREAAEQKFRQEELSRNFRLTRYGIFAAVVCVLIIMAAAACCAHFGHPVTGSVIGSGGIVVIVTVLVCGSRLNNNGPAKTR